MSVPGNDDVALHGVQGCAHLLGSFLQACEHHRASRLALGFHLLEVCPQHPLDLLQFRVVRSCVCQKPEVIPDLQPHSVVQGHTGVQLCTWAAVF